MDIKNIIKRLQDIDKFKLVLFNDHQRRLFETLPKPGIGSSSIKSPLLTMASIIKNKKPKNSNFGSMLMNDNSWNKRLVDLLDPKMKGELMKKRDKKKKDFMKVYEAKKDSCLPKKDSCLPKKDSCLPSVTREIILMNVLIIKIL